VPHLETSVMGDAMADFCRFFTKCCMSGIRAICFRSLVLFRPRVRGIW
jgi:hypothetical protein